MSETLDTTPAKRVVIEHARAKYRCEKAGEASVRVASAEVSPLPKSNASAGLLAQVRVAKYADGLPLARQEKIFRRQGVELSRATLCEGVLGSTQLLAALLPTRKAHVLAAPVIFAADTTLDLLEPGRGSTRTARLGSLSALGKSKPPRATGSVIPARRGVRVYRNARGEASAALPCRLSRLSAGR